METDNMKISMYSVFAGNIFDIPEKDLVLTDASYIPLKSHPKKNCRKCYNRRYTSRDKMNYNYIPCSCVKSVMDYEKMRDKYTQYLESQGIKE